MKKLLFITLIIVTVLSCNKKAKGFQIDVTINDMPNGSKVILKKQVDRNIINLDTTTIENGKFSFKGSIKEPMMLGMFFNDIKGGRIITFLDVTDHLTITAHKDSLKKSIIKGSELQDILTQMRSQRDSLKKESQKYFPEYMKAKKANDSIKMDSINNLVKKVTIQMAQNEWEFVKNNPNSFVSGLIFNGLMRNPTYQDSLKIVFDSFSDAIKNSNLAIPIKRNFEAMKTSKTNKERAISTGK